MDGITSMKSQAVTPRVHMLLMTVVAAASSCLAGWVSRASFFGWCTVSYAVGYWGTRVTKGTPPPLLEQMHLYPWGTRFVWQHPVVIGVVFFLACLGVTWAFKLRRPTDVRGQWLVVLASCLIFQVAVSASVTLPFSDCWHLEHMMDIYWKLRGTPASVGSCSVRELTRLVALSI